MTDSHSEIVPCEFLGRDNLKPAMHWYTAIVSLPHLGDAKQ